MLLRRVGSIRSAVMKLDAAYFSAAAACRGEGRTIRLGDRFAGLRFGYLSLGESHVKGTGPCFALAPFDWATQGGTGGAANATFDSHRVPL